MCEALRGRAVPRVGGAGRRRYNAGRDCCDAGQP